MPDGATRSAPARACDSAARPRFSSVASLSTSPSTTTPQWPCVVYSQKQASTACTAARGTAFLIARSARCTRPSSFHASRADRVLLLGHAEQDHRRDAELRASSASRTTSSTENWTAGHRRDRRAHALARDDEQRVDEVVGRERRLAHHAPERGVRRRRRGRVSGKDIVR